MRLFSRMVDDVRREVSKLRATDWDSLPHTDERWKYVDAVAGATGVLIVLGFIFLFRVTQ